MFKLLSKKIFIVFIKMSFYVIFALLIILLMLGFSATLLSKSSIAPVVKFHYSAAIDKFVCPAQGKNKILKSWHDELKIKQDLLEQEWNNNGPKLLGETSKLIGKPFSYAHADIPIFLCPNLPGMGLPLMIPVRMYLQNAVVEQPWHNSEFVDMVYHEILHMYVAKALHWNYWTPLLKKYGDEDINTKIHLHLFALQKYVYFHLGMEKQWQMVVARCEEFPPQYSRAIKIVEKEGCQPFIEELKK